MAIPKITVAVKTMATEGASGSYLISLDSPAPLGGLIVSFNTLGSTATLKTDYNLTAGLNLTALSTNSFTIAADATSAELNLNAVRDNAVDPNEIVNLNLIAGSGYDLITSFAPKADYPVGSFPMSVSIGDFDNDGRTDLAVSTLNNSTPTVLYQNSTGQFATDTSITPKLSVGVTKNYADFNNDGKLDFAVANFGSSNVSVYLQNADNKVVISNGINLTTAAFPVSVSVGDINNDGEADLAIANASGSVSALLNNSNTSAALTITDVGIIHPPVLTGVQATLPAGTEDTAYTVKLTDLLQGFTDPDHDTLKVDNPTATNGTLASGSLGNFIFTPTANYNGEVTVSYNVVDGKGGSVAATEKFNLTAVNDLPTGSVTIDDTTPQVGQTLTASNTLDDADGMGTVTYQWRVANAPVATGNTYTVAASDVSKALLVTANYIDQGNHPESVSSTLTSAVPTPQPGVMFHLTSSNSNTSEGNFLVDGTPGDAVTYAVTLATQPTAQSNVVLDFTSSDTTEGTVTPTLTFTSANWNVAQTVTISGVDDMQGADVPEGTIGGNVPEGNIAYTIDAVVDKTATTASEYLTIAIPSLTLQNLDDAEDVPINDTYNAALAYGADDQKVNYADQMVGSNLNDKLYAEKGADNVKGGFGDDWLYGKDGNDTLNGQQGNDTLYGGYQNDTLCGDDGNDTLYGEQDNDMLKGGNGNDYLDGGLGADTMQGNAGNDTYLIDDAKDVVDDQGLTADVDTVLVNIPGTTPYTYTLPANIENAALQGTGNNSLMGNDANNNLSGNSGNNALVGGKGSDVINGDLGADTLNGGIGADAMNGGAGNDIYLVDNTKDKVSETGNSGTDTVKATVDFTLPTNIENLTLDGSAVSATGNNLNNTITGDAIANTIDGGAGNDKITAGAGDDTVDGGAGSDILAGGTGNDTYVVDNANDKVSEAGGTGVDTVETSVDFTLPADVENLMLMDTAVSATGNGLDNTITGDAVANTIDGGAGNDKIDGGNGADVIDGGAGNDVLTGGTGADQFQLGIDSGIDNITDFTHATDKIVLDDKALANATLQIGELNADYFVIGTDAKESNDLFIYDNKSGELSYDADGSGTQQPVMIAMIGVDLTITSSDILLQ